MPLSLKLRANVCRNVCKLGIALLEESVDVPWDELSDVQRFWKTVVRLLVPLDVADALLELELNACAKLENVDAIFLYCCTCCDPSDCCGSDASGVSPLTRALLELIAALVAAVDAAVPA